MPSLANIFNSFSELADGMHFRFANTFLGETDNALNTGILKQKFILDDEEAKETSIIKELKKKRYRNGITQLKKSIPSLASGDKLAKILAKIVNSANEKFSTYKAEPNLAMSFYSQIKNGNFVPDDFEIPKELAESINQVLSSVFSFLDTLLDLSIERPFSPRQYDSHKKAVLGTAIKDLCALVKNFTKDFSAHLKEMIPAWIEVEFSSVSEAINSNKISLEDLGLKIKEESGSQPPVQMELNFN